MRTLVESDGSIATAVSRKGGRGVAVDRKAALMVQELKKYRINVVGISETKWFGNAVYDVDGYLVLHSGRPIPDGGDRVERNEGVGIVLDPSLAKVWRNSGEEWSPISSRIVSARLKLNDGNARAGRNRRPVYGSIVSVYAPTHRSSQEDKDKFFADLQSVIDGISGSDVLMIVGDFNARVGSGVRGEDDEWNSVRGCHGVGRINESGEALLSWCASNGLVVMNTVYEKKDIHKFTWQHPGSKQWHCIDHIIMRQRQRHLCCDVSVLRSADCWTDHKLLRAKLKVRCLVKSPQAFTRKRYDVCRLRDKEVCKNFNDKVCSLVEQNWVSELDGAGKWEVIRDSMAGAAEDVLGWETRRQPDWFKESSSALKGMIEERNELFGRWLRSRRNGDRQRYVAQRRKVEGKRN
jgi:hypothetical protein